MQQTKIEWSDFSWNPITGCTKISEGCRNCYAERMARRLAGRYGYPEAPRHFDVTLHPDRLNQPKQRKKWLTIFVCSMSDLFHEDVPADYQEKVWRTMAYTPRHTYLVLTKRAQQMAARMPLLVKQFGQLTNIAGMVSVANQEAADERIPLLLSAPFHTRGASCEPLLSGINLTPWLEGLDWVIVGGETGHGARPMKPQWARDIRDQCQAAGTPFFFKRFGGPHNRGWVIDDKLYSGRLLDGREWNEMPRRQNE